MSAPEWPPRPPATETTSVLEPSAAGVRSSRRRTHASVLPAQPTVRWPSSSLSRLRSTEPETRAGSRLLTPSSPTSSATVMRSSSGPCRSESSSASAIIAAIATPSSAPSVVPRALSQSPWRTSSILPSAGSFGLAGSRSQTMSRCPWTTTVGALSRAAVAGTRTTRFPAASRAASKSRSPAHSLMCATTISSRRDGRGILVSASKWRQKAGGSRPARRPESSPRCRSATTRQSIGGRHPAQAPRARCGRLSVGMASAEPSSEALVRSFFAKLSAGDLDGLKAMLHDEATWTIFAEGLPGAGRHEGCEAIVEGFLRPVREGLFEPGDPKVEIEAVVAAAGWVAVEARGHGRLADGRPYRNTYAFFLEIDDGKVRTVREYMDSLLAGSQLGER